MLCEEPTPGSVTDPRGSVGKTALTDLVDAYSQVSGVDWQHQLYSTLSNTPGVCARYRQNQVVANEVAARHPDGLPQRPAAGLVRARHLHDRCRDHRPDGTLRTVDASFQPFGRNCSAGGLQEATGGTVTYTTVTDDLVVASYDLQFGRSLVQGTFSAPMCTLCAPRPTSRSCLRQ